MTEVHAGRQFALEVRTECEAVGIDDESLQAPKAQQVLRDRFEHKLGDSWTAFTTAVESAVASPPYAVVIRGGESASARALLIAASICVGEIVNPFREHRPDTPVVHEIRPLGSDSPDLVWLWHTDSARWPTPNDYSALGCVRAAPAGGPTQVLSLDTVLAQPGLDLHALASLWDTPVAWPRAKWLGGGKFQDRCITPGRLRFRREVLGKAGSARFQHAVADFSRLADSCQPDLTALLGPGEVLLFDNRKVLHRAGPADDPAGIRLLLRTMMKAPART